MPFDGGQGNASALTAFWRQGYIDLLLRPCRPVRGGAHVAGNFAQQRTAQQKTGAQKSTAIETQSIEIETDDGARKTITPDWQEISAERAGSRGNPVRVYKRAGEEAYMQRLRCPDGAIITEIRRLGPAGIGPYTTTMDGYEIECTGDLHVVYLDMHHPGYIKRRAPPRFTLRNP